MRYRPDSFVSTPPSASSSLTSADSSNWPVATSETVPVIVPVCAATGAATGRRARTSAGISQRPSLEVFPKAMAFGI